MTDTTLSKRPGAAATPTGAASSSRRITKWTAVFAAMLFLLLAGLQVFSVLSNPSSDAPRDELLAPLADPASTRWLLREGGKPDGRPVATATFDERHGRILVGGKGLPEARADEVFVLWALDRGDDGRSPRRLASFRAGHPVVDAVVGDAPAPSALKALSVSVETNPRVERPTEGRIVASGGP